MERFYDPDEGTVFIDGQDLKSVSLRDFRSKVGYVGQEPVLFNQTIRENLRYGNPEATEEEMMEALKKSNASKIIDRLPDGIDTIVGAQGGQLSGGEKQRIALARAFVKDPKILILDEATSALDRQNEQQVQEAIDGLKNGHLNITTVVIAHRLSTIKDSDKIVVLKDGKVVEEGDHKSLLKDYPNGIYSEMVITQEQIEKDEVSEYTESLDSYENTENSDSEKDSKSDDSQIIETPSEEVETSHILPEFPKKRITNKATSFNEEMKNKKEQADDIDADVQREKDRLFENIKKKGYFKRLLSYNKPYWLIGVGIISSAIQGMTMPVFGILLVK